MKKNVAGQFVGALVIAKADGTPVTSGTTTVSYVGDNGTYTTGSVGSGSATHKGGGYWEYAPSQGETNFDHVTFVFVNTNGINAGIQIYTSFPQTGDSYARIGAPAGASVSADVAAVKSDTAGIKTKTDSLTFTVAGVVDANATKWLGGTIPAVNVTGVPIVDLKYTLGTISPATAGSVRADAVTGSVGSVTGSVGSVTGSVGSVTGNVGGNVTGSVGSVASGGITAASFAAGAINAAAIATNAIDADALATDAVTEIQTGLSTLTAADVRAAVGLASANLDTQLAGINSKTTNLPSDPADASDIATSFATVNATLATISGYVDTEVGAIKVVTDKLATTIELDGAVYRFTANALEQAPTGGGGTAPTAAEVADAVWDEAIADHLTAGSTGESLNGAGSAGNPWVSVIEGTLNAGDILRVLAGVAAGKTSIVDTGSETATVTFRDITDASDIVVASMDHSERETVTVTP